MKKERFTAIVTNAANGSGPAYVTALLKAGFSVAAVDESYIDRKQSQIFGSVDTEDLRTYEQPSLDLISKSQLVDRIVREQGHPSLLINRVEVPHSISGNVKGYGSNNWSDALEHTVLDPLHMTLACQNRFIRDGTACVIVEQPVALHRLSANSVSNNYSARGLTGTVATMLSRHMIRFFTLVAHWDAAEMATCQRVQEVRDYEQKRRAHAADLTLSIFRGPSVYHSGETICLEEQAKYAH